MNSSVSYSLADCIEGKLDVNNQIYNTCY